MLVSLIIGVAFLAVAWRPPVRDESRDATLLNPRRLSWGKPRLMPDTAGRIAQAALAIFGVFVLVDAVVDAVR